MSINNRRVTILTLFFIFIGQAIAQENCDGCNMTYIPLGNIKFPYGDENDINADVTLNETNMHVCYDKVDYTPEYGRCPYPPEDPDDMKSDPYIPCPEFPAYPVPGEIPPGVPLVSAEVKCNSCDVTLTPDGVSVNLRCIGCHDFPSVEHTADLKEKEIVYTVYYVQIANYTSVDVQGRENLNP